MHGHFTSGVAGRDCPIDALHMAIWFEQPAWRAKALCRDNLLYQEIGLVSPETALSDLALLSRRML